MNLKEIQEKWEMVLRMEGYDRARMLESVVNDIIIWLMENERSLTPPPALTKEK